MAGRNSLTAMEPEEPGGPNPLEAIIADGIAREGPMGLERFMELALYHPEWGYYERANGIGRTGDFVTGVSVGELFGILLAERFSRWSLEVAAKEISWVECGAHDGRLAQDVLDHCRRRHPRIYDRLAYRIIEPSARRKRIQRRRLEAHRHRVRWHGSWQELPVVGVEGVLFSNELLDAFPVDSIQWDATRRRWYRRGILYRDAAFRWCRFPEPLDGFRLGPFGDLPVRLLELLPHGFVTEVSRRAEAWWRAAASRLAAGYLVTFDYGLETEEFLQPGRRDGTLRAYREQRQSRDVLNSPGRQDLTSHVNFSALRSGGAAEGLTTVATVTQERFLTALLQELLERDGSGQDILTPARVRQWHSLTHPDHFGRAFSVLLQRREPGGAASGAAEPVRFRE